MAKGDKIKKSVRTLKINNYKAKKLVFKVEDLPKIENYTTDRKPKQKGWPGYEEEKFPESGGGKLPKRTFYGSWCYKKKIGPVDKKRHGAATKGGG